MMADPAVIAPASPLPWQTETLGQTLRVVCNVDGDDVPCASGLGDDVALCGDLHSERARADAAYIVRAANAYPELLRALHIVRDRLDEDGCDCGDRNDPPCALCVVTTTLAAELLAHCDRGR